jgi:hypothetical protein
MNLFAKAKKTPTKTAKKNSHPRLQPEGIEQDELFELIQDFEDVQTRGKKLKAREDLLKGQLREVGLDAYLKEYQENGKNPGTVVIESIDGGDTAQYMFVPSDRYVTVKTEEQANELEEKLSEGLVERQTTYSFDPKMLEKYADVISNLIEESEDIEEKDKGKLFVATETFKVKSGTIDSLTEYGEDVKEVFETLKPVVSLKNPQVINS